MRWARVAAVAVAALVGAGSALLGASPAAAGNWAVTVLDPVPKRIEAGRAYEVTFWVLQHGTHPYDWPDPLGEVGLALVDRGGATVTFRGRVLAEPAHFSATVTVPREGAWSVVGIQGRFEPYRVGALTVPGTVTSLGVPAAPSAADLAKYWPGPVRPPVLPIDQGRDPFGEVPDVNSLAAPLAAAPDAATPAAPEPAAPSRAVPPAAAWMALVLVAGAGVVAAWWVRSRPRAQRGPALPTPAGKG